MTLHYSVSPADNAAALASRDDAGDRRRCLTTCLASLSSALAVEERVAEVGVRDDAAARAVSRADPLAELAVVAVAPLPLERRLELEIRDHAVLSVGRHRTNRTTQRGAREAGRRGPRRGRRQAAVVVTFRVCARDRQTGVKMALERTSDEGTTPCAARSLVVVT